MTKGERGRFILTVIRINHTVVKQGLYERDCYGYDLDSDDGTHFHYFGSVKAIYIGKRYEVVAAYDGFRYGAHQLKRPKFQPEGERQHRLFEGG